MEKNYKFSLKEALSGWAKLVRIKLKVSKLSEEEQDVVLSRVDTCNNCKDRVSFNICGACGCYLPAKVVIMNQKCKNKLWKV